MGGTATDAKQDIPNIAALNATAGAIAGAIARLVVNPLDVLKIRFQVQLEPISAVQPSSTAASVLSKYTGLRQAFVTIVKEEGIKVADNTPSQHAEPLIAWHMSSIQIPQAAHRKLQCQGIIVTCQSHAITGVSRM